MILYLVLIAIALGINWEDKNIVFAILFIFLGIPGFLLFILRS